MINNINTTVSLNVNDDYIKDNIEFKESFDYKLKEKYIPLDKRDLNLDLQNSNKSIKNIIIENYTSIKPPSFQIDYDPNSKPSVVEVKIQSVKDDFYYWDYSVEKDEFLNFTLPSPILENKGLYYVQIDIVWKNKSNVLGTQIYNFNINLI